MIGAVPLILCLLQAPAASTPAPVVPAPRPAPNGPVVVLDTSMGKIRIGLHQDKAPISTANFLQYVKAKHYDGTIFHRVIPTFMIQGGGMTPDMTEKTGRPPIKNEARNGLRNSRGTVAMARTNDPNSATAQFFINVKENHMLDFGISGAGYAVFGEVLEGMDVVDKIKVVQTTSKGPHDDVPITPVIIKTARVEGGAVTAAPKPAATKPAGVAAKPAARPAAKPAVKKPSPAPAG
jgi:peptidyl-prolyl cis-trans isomerase A (cyclophilin A)